MTDYLEYTKGGYILIAPSLDYKHQYILKCFLCEEYFGEFEPFLSHCLSHNDEIFSGKMSNPSSSLDGLNEYEVDVCEDNEATYEYIDVEVEDLHSMQNDAIIKEEDTLQDSDMYYRHIDIEQPDESYYQDVKSDDPECTESKDSKISLYESNSVADESNEQMFYPGDMCYEDVGTDIGFSFHTTKSKDNKLSLYEQNCEGEDQNDQTIFYPDDMSYEDAGTKVKTSQSGNRKVSACVRKFMLSDRNTLTLIQAYRRQPLLWNVNYVPYRRTKERLKCVQKIVKVLKKKLNIKLTCNEVSGVLVFLRIKYKQHLMRGEPDNDESRGVLERLDFLKPFMENNYIAVLSEDRPYLDNEQISTILDIYKKFPILWNSSTIEHWCKNKRAEAVEEMVNVVNSEINLQLNHKLLENYLYSIHAFLTKEKRRDMGKVKGIEPRPEYYEHLKFLYDYVSPFKCAICHRFLRNPLYFKEHMMEHDPSIRLKCTLCDKEFKSAEKYVDHAKRHMEDLDIECNVCGKKFLKKVALRTHMLTHTGEKSFVCDICGVSYRHVQSLVIHKRKHNNEYIHHCLLCPKKFTSKTGLTTHMVTHKTERRFACAICNKAFKTKNTLRHHEWTHEEGCHPCELCGKTFKHKYKVYVHMKTHRTKCK